jgi:hypothetical protein
MGWYGKNRLVQGSSQNFQFGQNGHVTFVQGSGTSDIIFSGRPGRFRGHSHVRRLPTPTTGTFFTFNAAGKLVKTSNPYATPKAAKAKATKAAKAPITSSNVVLTSGTDTKAPASTTKATSKKK